MGNTQSVQRDVSGNGSEELSGENMFYPQLKGALAESKGRKDSITSQLFPNRKTRHGPSSLGHIKKRTRGIVTHSPSIFKKNYSLGEIGGAGANDQGDSNDTNRFTENVREGVAELSIKSPNGMAPVLFSPGPATPTVQPTKEEAIPPLDEGVECHNRRSVVALKKNLQESEQASCGSRSISSTNTGTRANSIDVEKLGRFPELPAIVTTTTSAMTINGAITRVGHSSSDTEPESSDVDNISDNGYLQSKDVVLNQTLLHNVIKRDMKRKRENNNDNDTLNTIEKNTMKNDAFQSMDKTLETAGDVHNLNGSNAEVDDYLRSGSLPAYNVASSDSLELGRSQVQSFKKLKPISGNSLSHPSVGDNLSPNVLEQHGNFCSIDSFEKGSVEHREMEEGNRYSSFSTSSSPLSGSSLEQSRINQNVHVTIKWRDELPHECPNKMSMVSEDIASTLRIKNPKCKPSNIFPMDYDASSKEWVVPGLVLPAGIYRLQFLINGELRHSNYLPTATDSVGNFVNWFEVIPGYDEVEPYRDEVELDSKWPLGAADHTVSDSALSHEDNRGGRPSLTLRRFSNRGPKSNTPFSDYTGISRSSSALRKSPINYTASSLDLRAALQPKKYKYTSEIPELFKTTPVGPLNDSDFGSRDLDPLSYDWSHHLSNTLDHRNKIVDCNQDVLFTELQHGGLFNAEMAERLFLEKYPVPDLPVYLNSFYLNKILSEFQKNNYSNNELGSVNHIIPHVNLNHLLTSSIRDEIISVGCTTRYEGKFITQVIYAPCYYENGRTVH